MTVFAGPGFGWGATGGECTTLVVLLGFVAIIACICIVKVFGFDIALFASPKAEGAPPVPEPSEKDLRARLERLSPEQWQAIRRLAKSGQPSEAIEEAGRILNVPSDALGFLAEELRET